MVAYSFKPRFIDPIRVGIEINFKRVIPGGRLMSAKRQTIRADRRRHARPGEEIQLYCGMRTRNCFLIGRAFCIDTAKITIHFRRRRHSDWLRSAITGKIDRPHDLDAFARSDGFSDWQELREFWRTEHPGIDDFEGVLIMWEPLAK